MSVIKLPEDTTADDRTCHCPASTARDGHLHEPDGYVLCLHHDGEDGRDCPVADCPVAMDDWNQSWADDYAELAPDPDEDGEEAVAEYADAHYRTHGGEG